MKGARARIARVDQDNLAAASPRSLEQKGWCPMVKDWLHVNTPVVFGWICFLIAACLEQSSALKFVLAAAARVLP